MQGIRHPYIKTSTSRKYTKDDMAANHIIEDSEGNQYTVDQLIQTTQTGLNVNDLITMLQNTGSVIPVNVDKVDSHDASDFILAGTLLDQLLALGSVIPVNVDKVDGLDKWTPGVSGGGLPYIQSNGIMELSRYIDFHHSNSDSEDYAARISTDGVTNGDLLINGNKIVTRYAASYSSYSGYIKFKDGLQICWGNASITPVANVPTSVTVTFPRAFITSPAVFTCAWSAGPGTVVKATGFSDASATGVNIYVYRTDTVATTVNWLAIGS